MSLGRWLLCMLFTGSLFAAHAAADDCVLERIEGPPADVAEAIAAEINPAHYSLRIGEQELCELWLAKSWQQLADEPAQGEGAPVQYRLQPGSLIGVIRLAETCRDLRDQEVPAGVYTLRYAVQPDIAAHQDSHESRDFLLLIAAGEDTSPDSIGDADKLIGMSADSVGELHPTFLPLLKAEPADQSPALRRDDRDPDGWILHLQGTTAAGQTIPLELILLKAV